MGSSKGRFLCPVFPESPRITRIWRTERDRWIKTSPVESLQYIKLWIYHQNQAEKLNSKICMLVQTQYLNTTYKYDP